jgi:hypothetical protein
MTWSKLSSSESLSNGFSPPKTTIKTCGMIFVSFLWPYRGDSCSEVLLLSIVNVKGMYTNRKRKKKTGFICHDSQCSRQLSVFQFAGVSNRVLRTSQYLCQSVADIPKEFKAKKSLTIETIDQNKEDEERSEHVVSRQQKFNLSMALIHGFFYSMNYSMVRPSSTMHVKELGAQDAIVRNVDCLRFMDQS